MVDLPGPSGCPTAASTSAWESREQGATEPPLVALPLLVEAVDGPAALLLPTCFWMVGFACPAEGVELLLHAASSSELAAVTVVIKRRWFVMAVSVVRWRTSWGSAVSRSQSRR